MTSEIRSSYLPSFDEPILDSVEPCDPQLQQLQDAMVRNGLWTSWLRPLVLNDEQQALHLALLTYVADRMPDQMEAALDGDLEQLQELVNRQVHQRWVGDSQNLSDLISIRQIAIRLVAESFVLTSGEIHVGGAAVAVELMSWLRTAFPYDHFWDLVDTCRAFEERPELLGELDSLFCHHSMEQQVRRELRLPAEAEVGPYETRWAMMHCLLTPIRQPSLGICAAVGAHCMAWSTYRDRVIRSMFDYVRSGSAFGRQAQLPHWQPHEAQVEDTPEAFLNGPLGIAAAGLKARWPDSAEPIEGERLLAQITHNPEELQYYLDCCHALRASTLLDSYLVTLAGAYLGPEPFGPRHHFSHQLAQQIGSPEQTAQLTQLLAARIELQPYVLGRTPGDMQPEEADKLRGLRSGAVVLCELGRPISTMGQMRLVLVDALEQMGASTQQIEALAVRQAVTRALEQARRPADAPSLSLRRLEKMGLLAFSLAGSCPVQVARLYGMQLSRLSIGTLGTRQQGIELFRRLQVFCARDQAGILVTQGHNFPIDENPITEWLLADDQIDARLQERMDRPMAYRNMRNVAMARDILWGQCTHAELERHSQGATSITELWGLVQKLVPDQADRLHLQLLRALQMITLEEMIQALPKLIAALDLPTEYQEPILEALREAYGVRGVSWGMAYVMQEVCCAEGHPNCDPLKIYQVLCEQQCIPMALPIANALWAQKRGHRMLWTASFSPMQQRWCTWIQGPDGHILQPPHRFGEDQLQLLIERSGSSPTDLRA